MTKVKSKAVVLFDPGSIELAFTGKISKNTLPAVREEWTAWLASFDAKNLETDQDFTDAAKFVTECKRVEDRLDGIKEDMFKGDTAKAIKEIDEMKETTRQKRLEFDRAVTQRKDGIKATALAAATSACRAGIAPLKYKPDADIEGALRAAIKGKSAILKMQEALDAEVARVLAEAQEYSQTMETVRVGVNELYKAAGETVTNSELDMLVKTYADDAIERAKFILDQKKVAREQAELDRKRKEEEALKAAPPAPAPVQAPSGPPARSALSAAAIPGAPIMTLRFGATFTTTDPEQTIGLINSIGGIDVKFQELKKGGTK